MTECGTNAANYTDKAQEPMQNLHGLLFASTTPAYSTRSCNLSCHQMVMIAMMA